MSLELTMTNTQKWLVSISPDGNHLVTAISWAVAAGDCTFSFVADDGSALPEGQAFIVRGTVGDSSGSVTALNSAGVSLVDTFLVHVIATPLPPATVLNLSAVGSPVNA